MFHHVARTRQGLLFSSWFEGATLWSMLVRAAPGAGALCLMPDHIHLLHASDCHLAIARAMSGYSRWRAARDGRPGPRLRPSPLPDPVVGQQKIDRSIRYIHLNPCRAGLVDDPLSWPFSTHLDALGLVASPARRRHVQAGRFHAYVSADPHVAVEGSPFPVAAPPPFRLDDLLDAVSVVTRTPTTRVLDRRGPPRALFLDAARALSDAPLPEIARFAGVSLATVYRARPRQTKDLQRVAVLASDPRTVGLRPHTFPVARRTRTLVGEG